MPVSSSDPKAVTLDSIYKKYSDDIVDYVNSTGKIGDLYDLNGTSTGYMVYFDPKNPITDGRVSAANKQYVKTIENPNDPNKKEAVSYVTPSDASYNDPQTKKYAVAVIDGVYYLVKGNQLVALKQGDKTTGKDYDTVLGAIKDGKLTADETVSVNKVVTKDTSGNDIQKGLKKAVDSNQRAFKVNGEWYLAVTQNELTGKDKISGDAITYKKISEPLQQTGATKDDKGRLPVIQDGYLIPDQKDGTMGLINTVNPGFNVTISDFTTTPDESRETYESGINNGHAIVFSHGNGAESKQAYNQYSSANDGAYKNIVQKKLGLDGYPVTNPLYAENSTVPENERPVGYLKTSASVGDYPDGQSLDYLFNNQSSNYSDKYELTPDNAKLFISDGNGGYMFDSSKYYAQYNKEIGKILVYNKADTMVNGKGQFFPLGDPNSAFNIKPGVSLPTKMNQTVSFGKDKDVQTTNYAVNGAKNDHYFGVKMSTGFTIPPYGKVNGKVDGKDMTFSFSGDDDFWLYIDDNLVLDLGGIHSAISGKINFATGEVTTTNRKGEQYTTSLDDILGAGAKDNKGNDVDLKPSASYSGTHTLSLFYLERGNYQSNLKLEFNLDTTQSYYAVPVSEFGTQPAISPYPIFMYGVRSNYYSTPTQSYALGVQQRYGVDAETPGGGVPPETPNNNVPPLTPPTDTPKVPGEDVPPLTPPTDTPKEPGEDVPPTDTPKEPGEDVPKTPGDSKTPGDNGETPSRGNIPGQNVSGVTKTSSNMATSTPTQMVVAKSSMVPGVGSEAEQAKLPQTGDKKNVATTIVGAIMLGISLFGLGKIFKRREN